MGRAIPLNWAEESRIEKWAESSDRGVPGRNGLGPNRSGTAYDGQYKSM